MPILTRQCADCGHRFELMDLGGVVSNMDREEDWDDLSCVKCGASELVALVAGASAAGLETGAVKYPYFDRGLGLTITSHKHRMRVCRERGLIPTEGELDLEAVVEDRIEKDKAVVRRYDAYEREMREGPNRAEFHQVMSQAGRDMKARVAAQEPHRRREQLEYERLMESWERRQHDQRRK